MNATSPAEWAAAGSAGLSAISLIALALAFADADPAYFDPRPLLGRGGDRVLVAVVNAKADAREMAAEARLFAALSLRDAALTVAALLMLLTASEATR